MNLDGVWERKTRSEISIPFSAHYGPNIPDTVRLPVEIFNCLFPNVFMDCLIYQSNLYCTQSAKKFDAITKEELRRFIGINIMMGIKKLPSYRDYWSRKSQINDPYISSLSKPVWIHSFEPTCER